MLTENMTPHALLGAVDRMLAQLVRHPQVEQGDKATCVLLGLQVNELRRKYMPSPPKVPLGAQFRMLPGAPEAEQDGLLGRAG